MTTLELSAADAVWIATALLHREHPERNGFTVKEITDRVAAEHLSSRNAMTIYQHANQHCVANRPPNAAKLRMLIETPDGLRRLYHAGDPTDPRRTGSRSAPEHLPEPFTDLAAWYTRWSKQHQTEDIDQDPLIALTGTWMYGEGDEYVNHLRSGWE
jgi:hypothetical protein